MCNKSVCNKSVCNKSVCNKYKDKYIIVMTAESDVCDVCVDKYTSKNSKVECYLCQFACCKKCLQRQLLNEEKMDYECMNCKKLWNYEYLVKFLPKNYVKEEYRNHLTKLLFERERQYMKNTQLYIEYQKQTEKLEEELKELRQYMFKLENQQRMLKNRMNSIARGLQVDASDVDKEDKAVFIKPCPAEGCKGFLSTRYKCGICEVYVCKECMEIKTDDEHTCNEDTVKTIKLLHKDSKGCPKCGVTIYKISGCDQMWCEKCHTAFSWNTLKIENGKIHNPHYYEWMRKNGTLQRDPQDVVCGGFPDFYTVDAYLKRCVQNGVCSQKSCENMVGIHRTVVHVEHITTRRFTVNEYVQTFKIQYQYMINRIDEREYKRRLYIYNQKNKRYNQIRQILDMFVAASTDIFQRMIGLRNRGVIDSFITEMNELFNYSNDQLKHIREVYPTCSIPLIQVGMRN